MKLKALLLDVDGTLVPVGPNKIPSERVIGSLKKAKDKVRISLVSGRSLEWLVDIFRAIDLEDPCIINGGSQIIHPQTLEVLWERPLLAEDVRKILTIARGKGLSFLVKDGKTSLKNPLQSKFEKPLAIELSNFDSKGQSDRLIQGLLTLPTISLHKFFSWRIDKKYPLEIYITYKDATKEHAGKKLAEILGVDPKDMIGVGDARNDIPLLSVCGVKVAMGNADNKLKAIADYVTVSVYEDGVCDVCEKFVFQNAEVEMPRVKRSLFSKFFDKFVDRFGNH